jgi:sialate O-acetylesterase
MKTTNNIRLCLFLSFILFSYPVFSKIVLPECFSDNMVLQQQTEAPIWGKADPNRNVKIIPSWDKKNYSTVADANGKWSVNIQTPQAGGPYSISISDGKELILKNVLIGEVWICSGQSNMEMPLAGWGKVLNYTSEIEAANYPNIRLLQVQKATSTQPVDGLKIDNSGWQICSPASVAEFSSVAYFFGRDLYQNLNVPIGLIHASWGGTIAEAWTSGEALKEMPDFKAAVQTIEQQSGENGQQSYAEQLKTWNELILSADKGIEQKIPVWASKNLADHDWKTMTLPVLWENDQLPDLDGIVWFRKTIEIPAHWAGKDLQLHIEAIDDNDITWFNGKEIGATEGYNRERNYTIPGQSVQRGKAVIAVRVTDTGGGGGIYGEPASLTIGLKSNAAEKIALSGNWKYTVAVNLKDYPPKPHSPNEPNRPTVLYNAMIYPLLPYGIQGAIWYQGESNAGRAAQYKELFPLMIRDWRRAWNRDFPFYFVQLANFMERKTSPQASSWAELREAQLQTLNLKNTGMAVAIDIGEAADIHPKNKQEVGRRLALAARAKTYHQSVPFSGPLYAGYTLEENQIRIHFNHAEGLKAVDGKALSGFAIAGSDHIFHWASAKIDGKELIVYSPEVNYPVAVRYAWADNPDGNLENSAGLPASPFRTDDWK